jgi:transcription factor IIIB subunit 2
MPPFPPRQRLASISGGGPRVRGRPRPTKRAPTRECPACKSTDLQDYEGSLVCGDCGATIDESNIVAEVTFGENSAGAAVVQGGSVGEGQRHATTLGPAFRRAGGGMESREVTENQGKDEIRRQANNLGLTDHVADMAFSVYKLACNANFIQGRRVNIVAATCLYIACRREKQNVTLLMDFSEAISVNVFRLGQTYQDLKKTLVIDGENHHQINPVIDVEQLILKFARKLEFGQQVYKVADDACRIIRRMKRDWMTTGRRPAGLCGACIILAARMNNFRRTVREVVYVVKVADMTVAKRLEEFSRTRASQLSVDQFREVGERLKVSHDPPALYERKMREKKAAEKRKRALMEDGDGERVTPEATRSPSAAPQGPRVDADGFAIPNLPIDPSLTGLGDIVTDALASPEIDELDENGLLPARKKRKLAAPIPVITEDDLVEEEALEEEMEEILADPDAVKTMEEAAFNEVADRAKQLAETLRNPVTDSPVPAVRDDPEIGEDEFDDDPEVRNCLLNEHERKIKERIWVTHNEDWLRAQQAKILKKALDEANGVTGKPKKARAKKGRMGDGSVLEGGTPVEDAADANQRMLAKRAKTFSKHINYDRLSQFYAGKQGKKAESTDASVVESDTESVAGTPGGNAIVSSKGGMLPTPAATQEVSTGLINDDPTTAFNEDEWEEEEDEEDDDVDEHAAIHEAGIDDGVDDDFGEYGYDGGDD